MVIVYSYEVSSRMIHFSPIETAMKTVVYVKPEVMAVPNVLRQCLSSTRHL